MFFFKYWWRTSRKPLENMTGTTQESLEDDWRTSGKPLENTKGNHKRISGRPVKNQERAHRESELVENQ